MSIAPDLMPSGHVLDQPAVPRAVAPSLNTQEKAALDALRTYGVLSDDGSLDKSALGKLGREQIRQIQISLSNAGLYVPEGHKYYADGSIGKMTLGGIDKLLAKKTLVQSLTETKDLDRADIRTVQNSLNELGYNSGRADGLLGPKTAASLNTFMADNQADLGALSPALQERMKTLGFGDKTASVASPAAVPVTLAEPADTGIKGILGQYEHSRDEIRTLQSFLKEQGHNVGPADGILGKNTMKGLTDFLDGNPAYHAAMGPNLTLETELYALDHPVSDTLKESLNLRDLSALSNIDNNLRYTAYRNYFESEGKPTELARGIKVASELTGVPMENLFAVMKQESINFGDYNPARGNSSANRIANNYGQFINSDYQRVTKLYGDTAQNELAREGIHFDPKQDWRANPLVAPYFIAERLKESGSATDLDRQYTRHVLPAFEGRENSNIRMSAVFPAAAAANKHIFGNRTFAQGYQAVIQSIKDEVAFERNLVLVEQRNLLKEQLVTPTEQTPYVDDRLDSFETIANRAPVGLEGTPRITSAFSAPASGQTPNVSPRPEIETGLGFRASFGYASMGIKTEIPIPQTPVADNSNWKPDSFGIA